MKTYEKYLTEDKHYVSEYEDTYLALSDDITMKIESMLIELEKHVKYFSIKQNTYGYLESDIKKMGKQYKILEKQYKIFEKHLYNTSNVFDTIFNKKPERY